MTKNLFRKICFAVAMLFLAIAIFSAPRLAAQTQAPTDEEIKEILIRESIARYSGSCPCPYNRDRAGRRCGKRSAYSRPGGASPICYPNDVSPAMIERYKTRNS